MVYELIGASLLATAFLSGIGAFFLAFSEERLETIVEYLISLSAGTIFGGVFIHLVFRLSNSIGYTRQTGLLVMAGIAGSLLLERGVHWHCHHRDHHVEPFSYVLLAGDAVHNVLDGILIATSFLAGVPSGLAATIAVMAHKVPKEAGDFGVLVHSGFSSLKAVSFNIAISFFMFIGAGLILASSSVAGTNIVGLFLPLVIGNFVYIAGSDLLPRFKKSEKHIGLHLGMFGLGVGIMYAIPYIKTAILG